MVPTITVAVIVAFLLAGVSGYVGPSVFLRRTHASSALSMARLKKGAEASSITPAAPDFVVGEGIPEDIAKQACIYDMILVERFSQPEKTDFGLFLPTVEGKDQKHLGKVLSVPSSYGLEGENGRLASIEEIAPYKVGDIVYIRDPWGIGPKDQEVGKRCFSFHKAIQITGVVKQA
jgi:co-chaperonin GroES (HSP10)